MYMQYIKNNQLTTIEQPRNAIVKVEPVELGEYTFNNSAYSAIDETTVTKIDNINNTLIGNLVGESDKIVNFEITVTIDDSSYLEHNTTSIVLTKRVISSLDSNPEIASLSCEYSYNGSTDTIVVNTTGSTYLQCCESIIDTINQKIQDTKLKYNVITNNGSTMLKVIVPTGITLTFNFDDPKLSYENGYIYNNTESTTQDIMTVPIDVNNINNVINYNTFNDGSLLFITLTNFSTGVCNVIKTTTMI